MTLIDAYDRPVDYLRLSINRDCNYACVYCDKEGNPAPGGEHVLAPGEAAAIVRAFNEIGGIKKVKITGGEPLLHPDVVGVVHAISGITTIREVSMTTNGFHLARLAGPLKAAGLARVNVSLCSIQKGRYERITGVDGLGMVLGGIDAAVATGLVPVKINYVIMRGINDGELDAMLDFCGKRGLRLQLIELHEVPDANEEDKAFFERHHLDVETAMRGIETPVDRVEFRDLQHRKLVFFENGASIEVVKPSVEFCASCTKIRVTHEGKIKPCLMKAGTSFDLLSKIREGRPAEEIRAVVLDAVRARAPYMTGEEAGCR
ncbi:MAG: GTP 3',8-cyclase MoaA [Candidatus Lokiarchaeota archaeon]|nr:GTP 3',8-cyclase MoaA [Candidatus Lokiarchaeota archaeon]